MIGRHSLNSTAAGAASPRWRATRAPAVLLLLAPALQTGPFAPAVDAATDAFHSAIFWYVLAVLLGGGCVYFLVRWLYERRILQQQENLHRLYSLSEIILESTDPAAVQKEVAEVAMLVTGGTHAYVLVLNSSAQQLDYVAGTSTPPLAAVSLSAISGAVTCFRSQALTEVPDAENCPFVKSEIVRRLGQKALLYVPIMASGSCLGVIEIEDRGRKRIFFNQQKTRAKHIARLAALGLRLRNQRNVQAHLHRTEKMAAVSELIEGLAETLTSPLRRLEELTANSNSANSSEAVARLQEMSREAQRAVATVERLADLARSRRGQAQQIDIHQLLETVQERWLEEGRALQLNLSRAPASVNADPEHLEQVILNLLRHGEHLLEGIGGRALQLSTNLFEQNIVISIGPPEDAERRDPEPYVDDDERMLDSESSLRLAVCQSLIEGFGGTLHIENQSNRGFRIELRYPLAADTLEKSADAPLYAANGAPRGAITALVIDPDESVQDTLLYMLSERRYRVVPVATAEEGIDLCEQLHFDCVFCDAGSSTGGLEVYDRIRSRIGRFVFLTGNALSLESDLSTKDCSVLLKPIVAVELDHVLASSLGPELVEASEVNEEQPAQA